MIYTYADFVEFEVKCRFCGAISGTKSMLKTEWEGKTPTLEDMGIADCRCDADTALHGDYADMNRRFLASGGTPENFKKVMEKLHFKKDGFDDELKKVKP